MHFAVLYDSGTFIQKEFAESHIARKVNMGQDPVKYIEGPLTD